jgi:hypothetical protein
MSKRVRPAIRESMPSELGDLRGIFSLPFLLRKNIPSKFLLFSWRRRPC